MLTLSLDALGLRDGARVLDLGCGRGRHLHALAVREGVFAVGADLSLADMAEARRAWRELLPGAPLTLSLADAHRLPFEDDAFDAVICSEVLEHVEDWEGVLSEIARIVRPGGRIGLSVPRYWPEAVCWRLTDKYANTPGGHVRIFKRDQLETATHDLGWRRYKAHHAHALHAPYWWLQCAVWDRKETHPAVAAYRKFLEWDILQKPLLTRALDAVLNPVMGKSLALYFETPA